MSGIEKPVTDSVAKRFVGPLELKDYGWAWGPYGVTAPTDRPFLNESMRLLISGAVRDGKVEFSEEEIYSVLAENKIEPFPTHIVLDYRTQRLGLGDFLLELAAVYLAEYIFMNGLIR